MATYWVGMDIGFLLQELFTRAFRFNKLDYRNNNNYYFVLGLTILTDDFSSSDT